MYVNHNLMASNVARNLNDHYSQLAASTQRLSSGLRINGAADDAAGLAIRELQRADIAALHQGVRNANDAISMLQVADGALGIIDEKLIRMKELAEQAATGTYDSTQRLMIDSEFQAMASEITRIANATDFNGIHLLDGTLNGLHDGSNLASEGKMKIHFGSGNDSAEDYYYVEISECTSEAFSIGNNSTWQDVQARAVESFKKSLKNSITADNNLTKQEKNELIGSIDKNADMLNTAINNAVDPHNAYKYWDSVSADEGFLEEGKEWPYNSSLMEQYLQVARGGSFSTESITNTFIDTVVGHKLTLLPEETIGQKSAGATYSWGEWVDSVVNTALRNAGAGISRSSLIDCINIGISNRSAGIPDPRSQGSVLNNSQYQDILTQINIAIMANNTNLANEVSQFTNNYNTMVKDSIWQVIYDNRLTPSANETVGYRPDATYNFGDWVDRIKVLAKQEAIKLGISDAHIEGVIDQGIIDSNYTGSVAQGLLNPTGYRGVLNMIELAIKNDTGNFNNDIIAATRTPVEIKTSIWDAINNGKQILAPGQTIGETAGDAYDWSDWVDQIKNEADNLSNSWGLVPDTVASDAIQTGINNSLPLNPAIASVGEADYEIIYNNIIAQLKNDAQLNSAITALAGSNIGTPGDIDKFWNSLRPSEQQKLQYAWGHAIIYNLAHTDSNRIPDQYGIGMGQDFTFGDGLNGAAKQLAKNILKNALEEMYAKVGDMDFAGFTIETQEDAQMTLEAINNAIVKKDKVRAHLGAMQNRLENTVSNLNIQAENLQAAESRISDVDVATEMTNFVRNQILTQAAVSMLSQANSMPQMAMQLIGG